MSVRPTKAMILAAGLGVRMRPLTDGMPKPLVRVAGRPLLDHVLDKLADAGADEAVVNVHYLPDQIINHAAAMHYMSGGQFKVPVVFRGPNGSAYQVSSQHSHALEAMYANFPGLKVVMPSTAADAKGLLKSSIRDDNPVIFMEQERMYGLKSEVPEDEDFTIPLGVADVKREGKDCTIVARSMTVTLALQAAEQIQKDLDVSVEVIDPRTIKPLDIDTIINSVKKTNRLVIAEESHAFASVGAEIAYQVMDKAFDHLDAPIKRISTVEAPMPYAKNLEAAALPDVAKIVAAVKEVCYL